MMYILKLKKNTYNYFQQCLNQTISKRLVKCLLKKYICERDIIFLQKSAKIKRVTEKLTSQIALKVRNGPNYVQLEDKLLFPSLLYVRCSMPSVLKFLRAESTELIQNLGKSHCLDPRQVLFQTNIAYWFIYLVNVKFQGKIVSNSVDLLENLNFILKSMSRQNCGKFLEFNIKLSFYQ